jgi:hypothetical protein
MQYGTILKDTTSIIFHKAEVRPGPSSSRNDIQSMINFSLDRQTKSTKELLRRLIEERDRKKLDNLNVNPSSSCAINFAPTNPQTSGTLVGGTTMPNPSAQPINHFHSQTTIGVWLLLLGCRNKLRPVCSGKGIRKSRLVFLCQTLLQPHTPPGATVEHTCMLATVTKPRTLP